MVQWIVAALTLAQVAQALGTELGETTNKLDFSNLGNGPWPSSSDFSWTWQEPTSGLSASAGRSLLGRRDLLQCASVWGQCGGKKWDGATCCASGSSCQVGNPWYSQCKPGGGSPKPTSQSPPPPRDPIVEEKEENVQETSPVSPSPSLGGSTFSGDATYYSDGTIGACSQTRKPDGFRTVALNSKQWNGGALCGTCIEGYYKEGYPVGTGAPVNFKAIIDNLCPECQYGDLDFRQPAGGPGDGRWPLEWKIIPCPSSGLTLIRENGNKYYSKLKVEGGPSPVKAMNCRGIQGKKTSDAFFEFQDNSGTFCKGGFECTVDFTSGGSDKLPVSGAQLGGFC